VLGVPPVARAVATELAAIQGCERSTLGPSTLHLVWDLFGILAARRPAIFLDGGTYPVARWGVERAVARGSTLTMFRHHDAQALREAFVTGRKAQSWAVVVTDGFCPSCGRSAPIGDYAEIAREGSGLLMVDDTQALGIFGGSPRPAAPYGTGGGGMLRYAQLRESHVVVICSLAKAFGVPLAVLSGSRELVGQFEEHGESRMHSSPPSIPTLHAAESALQRNHEEGDAKRLLLARLVQHFRWRMRETGMALNESQFPVQTLAPSSQLDSAELQSRLLRSGVRAVLHRTHHDRRSRLSFLITAKHKAEEIDRAVELLSRLARTPLVFATR
jgi:8-amino-7-oxononanoate synthase